jgi:hypothetical protein
MVGAMMPMILEVPLQLGLISSDRTLDVLDRPPVMRLQAPVSADAALIVVKSV